MEHFSSIKEIYVNPNEESSISVLVTKTCNSFTLNTRHLLSDVLQRAKRDLSNFMLRLQKIFHHDTRSKKLTTFMKAHAIEEIQAELGCTDTDSCKYQITAVAREDAAISHDDFAVEIRRIVYQELKDLLDTSDEHFKNFDVHDLSTKKKFGTFGVDEIDGVPSILEEDQLKFALYAGPKKSLCVVALK